MAGRTLVKIAHKRKEDPKTQLSDVSGSEDGISQKKRPTGGERLNDRLEGGRGEEIGAGEEENLWRVCWFVWLVLVFDENVDF